MHVSVIIPTYNRAPLLARTLDSVLAQTRKPDEIIVVDDGSTDATQEMMQQRFPSLRYLAQQNSGVSAARNHGIRQAQGEWFAFLDSDDTWYPDKLARQIDDLQAHPETVIAHTDEIWIRRGKRVNAMNKHAKAGGYIYRRCLPLCVISPSSVIIHRRVFDEVGLFDETLPACEDYDLWLRICACYPVRYLDTALITKYGGHDDQLSRRFWGMDRFRIIALEKMLGTAALMAEDRRATLEMLIQKLTIVGNGSHKRGKVKEAERYATLRDAYAAELAQAAA